MRWSHGGPSVSIDSDKQCGVALSGGWGAMEIRGWLFSKERAVCYQGSSYGTAISSYGDTEGLRTKDHAMAVSPCRRYDLATWALAWCGWSVDMTYCTWWD